MFKSGMKDRLDKSRFGRKSKPRRRGSIKPLKHFHDRYCFDCKKITEHKGSLTIIKCRRCQLESPVEEFR